MMFIFLISFFIVCFVIFVMFLYRTFLGYYKIFVHMYQSKFDLVFEVIYKEKLLFASENNHSLDVEEIKKIFKLFMVEFYDHITNIEKVYIFFVYGRSSFNHMVYIDFFNRVDLLLNEETTTSEDLVDSVDEEFFHEKEGDDR